jgi:uncharacterized membrane protein
MAGPPDLVALVRVMLAGLVESLLVNLGWKLSIHTGVAAGSVAVLVLVSGPPLLALSPIVRLIGWARVELRDHSPAQATVGAVLGATVAATSLSLLR